MFCDSPVGQSGRTPIVWPPRVWPQLVDVEWEIATFQRAVNPYRWERRIKLFRKQWGKCYWCDKFMSLRHEVVTETGKVKLNNAFATFEHKVRRYDGGTFTDKNIVLAHGSCNRKREKVLPPNGPRFKHLLPDVIARGNQKTAGVGDDTGTAGTVYRIAQAATDEREATATRTG